MSTPVEQIKERLGIADVIGGYLKLERAGASFKGKCPFHNEKTPSFFVSPARNSYYCFGCQAKGDIFTFVQEFEGLDFIGALRVLAGRAGVTLTRVDPKIRSEHARLYLLLERATRFFELQLQNNLEATEYIRGRGLTEATQKEWRIGFAPNEWRALFDYLIKEGSTPEEMERVGLVKRAGYSSADIARNGESSATENTTSAGTSTAGAKATSAPRRYDAFRGRIMFPIVDSASRVIAFTGRILPTLERPGADIARNGESSATENITSAGTSTTGAKATSGIVHAKYINSPETILFSKSHVLHGFHLAKLAIRKEDATILVEGQMDLLMAHQAGFTNTVASSGTALTVPQLERLKRLSENLLISFDSDNAGLKAAERAIHLALSLGMNVRIIKLSAKDPADLIAKDVELWRKAVLEAKHVIDFLLDEILASPLPSRDKALRIERNLLPLLRRLPSKVEQSHFLKLIADRARLREDALFETLKKIPGNEPEVVSTKPNIIPHRSVALERRVFGTLLSLEESKGEGAKSMATKLKEIFGENGFKERYTGYQGEKDVLLAEVELLYNAEAVPEAEASELMHNLEEEALSTLLAHTMEALTTAEQSGRGDDIPKLLEKCKSLGERLSEIKSLRYGK